MIDEKEIPPYVASAKEQEEITIASRFRKEAYEHTRTERQQWRNSYFRYKLSRYLSEYEYIPDVPMALTYDSVERISAALPGGEFGFRGKPTDDEDITNSILFSEAMNYAWRDPAIMDGPTKMDNIKKQMALFGSAFAQVFWETKMDKEGNVIKSDPQFWPLNIFDVYYNKFAPEIEDMPEIGYQSIVSLDWLKKNAKTMGYKNAKYVKGFQPRTTDMDEDSSSIDHEETMSGKQKKDNDLAKIFEIQSDDIIKTFAIDDNGWVFLRKRKNKIGRKNVVIFRLKRHPLPNRLLGVTDVQRGGAIEDAIQRQMNQAVFNTLLVDNPNFTYDYTDRNIDPRTFITAPGAGIPRGKDQNAITPIQFPSHLNDSLAMINTLMERYKRVVNTPDITAGLAEGNTATSDSINDANAKASTEKIVDGMKASMTKLGDLMRELYKEYGDESMSITIRTPELLESFAGTDEALTVDVNTAETFDLDRDIDIEVDFTVQNKMILSRRIVEWLTITAQDPTVPPSLRMKGYQKWLEFNDLDDLAKAFQEQAGLGQTSDLSAADQENQQLMNGQALPPTPNASKPHMQRHVELMRMDETGPEIDRIIMAHIEGEIAQQQGGQQQPGQEQLQQGQPQGAPQGPPQEQSVNPIAEQSTIGIPQI